MRRLVIGTAATADMAQAAHWYDAERPGLGRKFTDAVDTTLARIVHAPFRFPILTRNIRRARMNRFPYGLYFIVADDDIVRIACLHGSRAPSVWMSRA